MVTAAKAFRLQAIDLVYIDYKARTLSFAPLLTLSISLFIDFMIYNCYLKDVEGLTKQSEEGARFGFTGKQVR